MVYLKLDNNYLLFFLVINFLKDLFVEKVGIVVLGIFILLFVLGLWFFLVLCFLDLNELKLIRVILFLLVIVFIIVFRVVFSIVLVCFFVILVFFDILLINLFLFIEIFFFL